MRKILLIFFGDIVSKPLVVLEALVFDVRGICFNCEGRGKEKCPRCDGYCVNIVQGTVITCIICAGKGYLNKRCSMCLGTGKKNKE